MAFVHKERGKNLGMVLGASHAVTTTTTTTFAATALKQR